MIIFIALISYVFSITVIDTHYNKSFIIEYNIPGSYLLNPKDYKYAPTLFVVLYGAGGGADIPYIQGYGSCTGQNGAYLSILLDTNSGRTQFQLTVGRGGTGGKTNITGCGPKFGKLIPSTNGGDSSFISSDKKFCATSKGGLRSETVDLRINNNVIISCRGGLTSQFEVGGYTNVTYMRGVTLLERKDGENSYFGAYFNYNISGMGPGYGGRGQFLTTQRICNADYQLYNGGHGNDGSVKIIPVKIKM